jgi:hypothetical protein
MGLGHALELAHQKVVQALAGAFGVHRQVQHGACRGGGAGALYNVFLASGGVNA